MPDINRRAFLTAAAGAAAGLGLSACTTTTAQQQTALVVASVPPADGGIFMASGWGGQLVWVHPGLDLVVAVNSTPSPASQERGHAMRLLRGGLVAAVQARAGGN